MSEPILIRVRDDEDMDAITTAAILLFAAYENLRWDADRDDPSDIALAERVKTKVRDVLGPHLVSQFEAAVEAERLAAQENSAEENR